MLAIALALGLGQATTGQAQSLATGSIYGQAEPGDTVHIESTDTGFKRDIPVDGSGRYRANSLPIGTYKVSLIKNGATVESRGDVHTQLSQGVEVNFADAASASHAKNLGAVQVVGNELPTIDVSSVDSRTVVTAQQLAQLPLARTSISAVALLAPGTTPGAKGYGDALSFGGSSKSENAYYVNGFSITNPLTGVSSRQLPYDAIDQEQVLIGGYSAQYGRSTGGVINVVTKRGTNEWKGDVQVLWAPSALAQQPRNTYRRDGSIYQRGNAYDLRNDQSLQYSASIGGPLIKDKLFFFAAADWIHEDGNYTGAIGGNDDEDRTNRTTRWLTKIDWNINDSNILEFTGFGDNITNDSTIYAYDYGSGRGDYLGHQTLKNYNNTQTNGTPGGNVYIANYTGYLTDNLTLTAMYGKSKSDHSQDIAASGGQSCPGITDNRTEFANDPAHGCTVGSTSFLLPGSQDKTNGWNIVLEYRLGDHDIRAGVDNYVIRATWGSTPVGGTGYTYWDVGDGTSIKNRLSNLGLDPGLYNPAWYPNGYYVEDTALSTGTSARTNQRSQFIEDTWQVTDRWLAKIGLRNEQFTNYNGAGEAYARSRHQLDPRLGVTWDVYGDSSLKIYANAGRYHLGLPTSVAIRGAGPSSYPSQYLAFTGIDPVTGIPTGIDASAPAAAVYYKNGANGIPPDGKTVAAQQLHSYYQDEYILGFDKALDNDWTVGAKTMYRKLKSLIDDTCDPRPLQAWGDANGLSDEVAAGIGRSTGCWLFNPGRANTFTLSPAPGQYLSVPLSAKEIGEPKPKRAYYMLDLYAEHKFDEKWYGRVDYTFSRSYGNSEGQLDSDIVQADVSTTESWDFPEVMEHTNGPLANDQKHQLRVIGTYQPTEEWLFSTVTRIASGYPVSCIGVRPQGDPFSYGAAYFYCNGKPSPRGSAGRTPWTYTMDVTAQWKPSYFDHKLTFSMNVFNLLGKQRVTQYYETGEQDSGDPNVNYKRARSFQDPRYVQLGARYDFSL